MQRIGPTLLSGKPLPSGSKSDVPGTLAELSSIAFGADGRTVVAGSSDGSVFVWQYDTAASGDKQPTATADGPAGHLLMSPDGRLLVTTNPSDGSLKLWDITALKPTATLTSADLEVGNATAAFSPDGNLLATDAGGGTQPTSIVLWDVQSRTRLATLPGQTGFIRQIAFSPDGHLIASAADDGTSHADRPGTASATGVPASVGVQPVVQH